MGSIRGQQRFTSGASTAPGARFPAPTAQTQRAPFERTELANGIVLLGEAQPDDPSMVLRFRTGAGAVL